MAELPKATVGVVAAAGTTTRHRCRSANNDTTPLMLRLCSIVVEVLDTNIVLFGASVCVCLVDKASFARGDSTWICNTPNYRQTNPLVRFHVEVYHERALTGDVSPPRKSLELCLAGPR